MVATIVCVGGVINLQQRCSPPHACRSLLTARVVGLHGFRLPSIEVTAGAGGPFRDPNHLVGWWERSAKSEVVLSGEQQWVAVASSDEQQVASGSSVTRKVAFGGVRSHGEHSESEQATTLTSVAASTKIAIRHAIGSKLTYVRTITITCQRWEYETAT